MEREGESYWQEQIAAWRESGETQKAYCARQGLKPGTFRYWRWRLAKAAGVAERESLSWIPATVRAEAPLAAEGVSLESPGGWRRPFTTLPPAAWLAALVASAA